MRLLVRSVLFVIWSLCIFNAFGGTTGKIAGKIKDAQTREPLIGANVVLEGTNLGAAADPDGYYSILNVPPGKYRLVASAMGYARKIINDVAVQIDLTTTIDIELSSTVIELGQVVEVTASAPVVRKDLTSSEARIDAEAISILPAREVGEILSLQAGVTVGRGGDIHIRGGRSNEVGYWVDGVSVSDVYDGGQAVRVDNGSVQELQVISGTFNAEYGQAMSGIVNIVTKDGDQKFRGNVTAYSGSYVTADNLYYNMNKVRPLSTRDLEGSLSGPVPGLSGLTFYGSGRAFYNDGWLYGNRTFTTTGTALAGADTVRDANGTMQAIHGASDPVPMNWQERYSGQLKFTYNFSSTMKLNISGIGSRSRYKDYNHAFRLEPDGDVKKYDNGYSGSVQWTHTVTPNAFYTVNFSYFRKEFREHLYTNPFDSRYQLDPTLTNTNLYEFLRAGTNLHQFKRNTDTRVVKADLTSQMGKLHQLKAGFEGKLHTLFLQDYGITPFSDTVRVNGVLQNYFRATIPPASSPLFQEYNVHPVEFSAYVQDKLEYESMIVNVGLRFDYFNSKGKILVDPQDPNVYLPQKVENQSLTLDQRMAKWYKNASPKYALSPRLGISYPITDKGILHFSYGHFLQIPSFSRLFQNTSYKVDAVNPLQGVYGNPNLNPERAVMYEFGLQQQMTEDLSFDVTGFYKDTRDWVGTSPKIPVRDPETATTYYTILVNKDYGNTRGITLTVNKRPSHMIQFNFSYTFQTVEGNNSSEEEEQGALLSNREPEKSLVPLDWDQTHVANLNFGVSDEGRWGAFLLGKYGSGLPYTPVINQAEGRGEDAARVVQKNSRRQPATITFDLHLFTNFSLGMVQSTLWMKVFNLFDRRNEVSVYGQTGRASATLSQLNAEGVGGINRINTAGEAIVRPDFYSEPRQIQIGIDLSF